GWGRGGGLAGDMERFRNHEPVLAGPPGTAYRLRKFVRRHKGQVIAAGLVLFVLLAGMAGTTWGLFEARRQAGIARDETADKEKARQAEALRVTERDEANDELKHRLGVSSLVLASAALDKGDVKL